MVGPVERPGQHRKGIFCKACFKEGHWVRECPKATCIGCGGIGHVLADCVNANVKCFSCNRTGHVRENCPEHLVETRMQKKDEEIAILKLEATELKQETTESEQTIVQHEQDVTGLVQDVINYRQEVEDVKQETADLRKESAQKSAEFERETTQLKQENTELKQQLAGLEQQLFDLREGVKVLKQAPLDLQVQNAELKEEITHLNQELHDEQTKTKALRTEVSDTKEKKNKLGESLIKCNERNKAMEFTMTLKDLQTHSPKAFTARYNNYIPHLKSRFYAHPRYPFFIQSICEDIAFIADKYLAVDTLLWRHHVAMSLMRCCAKILASVMQEGGQEGESAVVVVVDEWLRVAMDDADHLLQKIVLEFVGGRVEGGEARTTFDEELEGLMWVVERDGRFFWRTFGLVDSLGGE